MDLHLLMSICLCSHVFVPDSVKTVLKTNCNGVKCIGMEIVTFKAYTGMCTLSGKTVISSTDDTCPDNTCLISKSALSSNTDSSALNQPRIVSCQPNPTQHINIRRYVNLPSPLKIGGSFTVIATPKDETRITMYLSTPYQDRPLIYTIGFEYRGLERVVVRSYLQHHQYVALEKSQENFPYEINRESNTTVSVGRTEYRVHVDGVQLYTFKYEIPHSSVTKITVIGKIKLKAIIIK